MDGRPAIANRERQLQPIHGARHINVCENSPNVWLGFEHSDSFVSISRF